MAFHTTRIHTYVNIYVYASVWLAHNTIYNTWLIVKNCVYERSWGKSRSGHVALGVDMLKSKNAKNDLETVQMLNICHIWER